jgi:hypothetical protein
MASSKGGKERLPKLLRVDSLYKNMCVIIFWYVIPSYYALDYNLSVMLVQDQMMISVAYKCEILLGNMNLPDVWS